MNSVKISIIIPVYNAEKTLCRCIDSILAQSLAEFEAIFVDDCSTDGSAAIIAEYARRDARIRLVSLKKNGGAGNARNVGIEHARGDYLSFVDSDDTIAPDFLELLFKKADETKAEVVRGAHLTIIGNDFNNAVSVNKMHHQNELYEKAIKDRRKRYILFKSAHFAAIYRRAFIMDNAIRYGKTVVSEDSTFLVKILTLVRSVAFERNAIYHYILNENSLTNSFSRKRFDATIAAFADQLEILTHSDIAPDDYAPVIIGRLQLHLRFHSILRSLQGMGDYADAYAKRILDCIDKYGLLPLVSNRDYAVDVFLNSYGEENVFAKAPFVGSGDDTALRLAALKRLADHLVSSRFRAEGGMEYLEKTIKSLYSSPSIPAAAAAGGSYHASIISKMHDALTELNAPEHLAKMSLLVRAIVEYGADLTILPSTGSAESPEMYFGCLERTVALLRIHPQAARVYFDYADFLSKRLFALALSMLLSDPSKAATIFDALFIVCNELNGIKEKRKGMKQNDQSASRNIRYNTGL